MKEEIVGTWVFIATIVAILFLAAWLALPAHARSSFVATRLPFSCDVVRMAAQIYSPTQIEQMARDRGIQVTQAQRHEAYKCLAQK